MVIMIVSIAVAVLSTEGSLTVDIGGSPPVPVLYELGIDSVLASDSSITVLQESILQWYLEEGYPFAGAGYYFVTEDSLRVNTVPGRHALLEEIRIEGVPGTRTEVFTRLLGIEPVDAIDPIFSPLHWCTLNLLPMSGLQKRVNFISKR